MNISASVIVRLCSDFYSVLVFLFERPYGIDDPFALLHTDVERRSGLARSVFIEHCEGGVREVLAVLVVSNQVDEILVRGDTVPECHHAELKDVSVPGTTLAWYRGFGAFQYTIPAKMGTIKTHEVGINQ